MKVLFVSSGNSEDFKIAPFIKAQGDSLQKQGVELEYFTINGKGFSGYFKSAIKLRKYLKQNPFDIIHAHYTLSGWSAVLSLTRKPIVLSLMGNDAYGNYIGHNKITFKSRFQTLLTYLIQPFVKSIICKSKHIESFVFNKNKSYIVPNGIILNKIKYKVDGFRKELGLSSSKKYVLFLGSETNVRKNYKLAKEAILLLNSNDIELISPYPISHHKVIKYLNAVDMIVVPSFMEGSPNVVKEAMACNLPVVATNVGDVKWLFGDEPGYFITSFGPEDVAEKIKMALEFKQKFGRTNGRKRIINLGLDSEIIAKKIINVYKKVLS